MARSGLRRMFSVSAFAPRKAPTTSPNADPSTNLFISGLSRPISTEGLRNSPGKFGELVHGRVVADRVTGFSKVSRQSIMWRPLTVRCLPPVPRRHLHGHQSGFASEIAKLSEEERVEASKLLDKMDEEMQRELVQQVHACLQRSTLSNDKGNFSRVLTFFRVPKGEFREKLIWRSSLAIAFIASWALGRWEAESCLQYVDEKQRTHEAASHQKAA